MYYQSVFFPVIHPLIPNTSRKEKSRYTCVGWGAAWSPLPSYRPRQSHLYMPPGWGSTPWPPRLVSLLQHQPISLDKKCHDIHKEEFLKRCMVHHPQSSELHTTLLAKYTPGSIPVPDSRIQVKLSRIPKWKHVPSLIKFYLSCYRKSQYTPFLAHLS